MSVLKINLMNVMKDCINIAITENPKCIIKMNPFTCKLLSRDESVKYSKKNQSDEKGIWGVYTGTDIILDNTLPDLTVIFEQKENEDADN